MTADRDPFRIIDEAQTATRFNTLLGLSTDLTPFEALTELGLDVPASHDLAEELSVELRATEQKFCWGTHGVGVFSGDSVAETQFWDYMLRKLSGTIQSESGGTIASLSVLQAFNPDVLMPSEVEQVIQNMSEAGFAFRTGASDLAKAVESIARQTRVAATEPITFLVTMPDTPDHITSLMRFDSALTAGNETATALRAEASREQKDYFNTDTETGRQYVQNLHRRLKVFLDEVISTEAPEQIPGKLRQVGEQTSPLLAQGLEYLYYKRLLAFVDAGAGYRSVPENVRIGLVVDKIVYDAMLARGLNYPYATVKLWDPEAALGCYATIPRNSKNHNALVGRRIETLRSGVWQQDPVTPSITSALLFADTELPRFPAEDF